MARDFHYTDFKPGGIGRILNVVNSKRDETLHISVGNDDYSIKGPVTYKSVRALQRQAPKQFVSVHGISVLAQELFERCEDLGVFRAAEKQ